MIQTCKEPIDPCELLIALIRIDYDFTLVKLASPVELIDHVAPARVFPSESQNLEETFPPEMTFVLLKHMCNVGKLWGVNRCDDTMIEIQTKKGISFNFFVSMFVRWLSI